MGDPIIEEANRVRSENTDAIVNPYLSVSDENQNRLNETGAEGDWGVLKQDAMSNIPEEKSENDITKFSLDGSALGHFCRVPGPSPSPSLLAALQSLGEHSDHMLLPHSLHQVSLPQNKSVVLQVDLDALSSVLLFNSLTAADPWAVQFLHLERLYHERLLSNLAFLQQEWESQWKADAQAKKDTPVKTNCTDAESKCMDSLSHICRTHQRPHHTLEKDMVDLMLKSSPRQRTVDGTKVQETTSKTAAKTDDALQLQAEPQEEDEKEQEGEEEDEEEDIEEVLMNEGLMEEDQEEEEPGGESLCEEELAELIRVEEVVQSRVSQPAGHVPQVGHEAPCSGQWACTQMCPSNGLVSILKKRACQENEDPANNFPSKPPFKRKVRFSETEDTLDNDEVGGASCLLFFLLCLVTVVISMGGTAVYCLLGGTYSNVCADFSQNMDFYFGSVWRGVDTIAHWFAPGSS
ncbi:hypothetical protein NFI96_031906 [Prochilodus magdalenae]|nr:hypothetical protein NFI96_031906 [Prochilodus magdalenae]